MKFRILPLKSFREQKNSSQNLKCILFLSFLLNKKERKRMNCKWKDFHKETIILDVVYVLDLYK